MNNRAKEILTKLDREEIIALAYDFPLPDEDFYESFVNDDNSEIYTTDADGEWKPLEISSMFDGFEFTDEYNNFLTKKSRERRKRKQELRKEGSTRKEARQQAREEIPRTTLKEVAKKVGGGFKKIGRGIVVGAVALPRASFLSLVAINYRGFGWKLDNILNQRNGTPASVKEKLKQKWYKLGGNWDKLQSAIRKGASRKKPFFCGKKCKKKLVDADAYKRFANFSSDFYNFDPATSGVTAWVGIGSGVIGTISPIIALSVDSKNQKQAMANEKYIAEKSLDDLSEKEKREIELAEEKLKLESDPKNVILQNPNLTPQEKELALKQLADATSEETSGNLKKYALYGGLGLIGLFLVIKMFKK